MKARDSMNTMTDGSRYLNGSILIATLQPAFTILHTLTTSRAPSRITGLAWHGSSSKQKTDMLATQTAEGDLRVWSVPKAPHQEAPTVIRALGRSDIPRAAPCWFSWSKNGRIVQHYDGYVFLQLDMSMLRARVDQLSRETRSWDVRTKRVTYDLVPTIEGVVGIASYGPTATLFTMGRNHTIQQYDVSPTSVPLQVQSVQHVPANTPPTPPTTLEEHKNPYANSQSSSNTDAQSLPITSDVESSADEGNAMSPLQKIAKEMDSLDQLESELRDKITPLSPTSSRASSVSSKSSGGAHRQRKYLYDRPSSSRASTTTGYEGTEFSFTAEAPKNVRDSMSIRSESTRASHTHYRSSSLRKEILRSPEEAKDAAIMDLFPYTKARLRDVALQTPHYGETARTPEILQREMLSVVFGWNDTVETLIREEMARHKPGSASTVLLAKWLGDMGADNMASMVGSQSMTSSDWMLLALSSIGQDSQKKVGEAFVQRLLEKGDIHPAVAILLGLGETHDAIEVYVSQGYFMEAILLTSLSTPSDWGRQTYLLRKWGEVAIRSGEPELAVRIFSCASIETTIPWSSPGAQNAVFAAQNQQDLADSLSPNPLYSPPLSPPSRSGSGRLTAKNASLKLITTFGARGVPVNTMNDDPTPLAVGLTPIITSALSPGEWRPTDRTMRAPSSARTATPGGFGKRRRMPSKGDAARSKQETYDTATPLTAARDRSVSRLMVSGSRGRRTPSISDTEEPATALRPTRYEENESNDGPQSAIRLPSPSRGVFARSRTQSRPRQMSKDRYGDGLKLQIVETRYVSDALSPGPSTQDTSGTGRSGISRNNAPSPAMTNASMKSAKTKAIDDYINSVEQARLLKRHARPESRTRGDSRARGDAAGRADSRSGRAASRVRDRSEVRGRADVHYIKAPKRSPSSPVPMSPEEIAQANAREAASNDPEHFYKSGQARDGQEIRARNGQDTLPNATFEQPQRQEAFDDSRLHADDGRGRSDTRMPGSSARSPSSPLPSTQGPHVDDVQDDTQSDGRRIRSRAQSSAREDLQTRRAASRSRPPGRSDSCRSNFQRTALLTSASQLPDSASSSALEASTSASDGQRRARAAMTRKELAARELEERRLSLARRPSAPAIPMPNTIAVARPRMSPRSQTELGNNPHSLMPPISRSQTADPEAGYRYGKPATNFTSSASIGLPATPRAMKHPQYMGHDPDDRDVPPVPHIPDNVSSLAGSLLSQTASSSLSHAAPSSLSQAGPSSPSQVSSSLVSDSAHNATEDTIAPLLPSTVFGKQGPQAPPRAASAPLEKSAGSTVHPAYKVGIHASSNRRLSGGRGHVRKISPPEHQSIDGQQPAVTSIDEAIYADQQVIIVDTGSEEDPILLPELQHLAMPPPPPPPTLYQYVNKGDTDHAHAVVDVNLSTTGTANSGTTSDLSQAPSSFPQFPYSMERASTASPHAHRRGHGSISESFGSRMRGVADRMRNGSRSRAKSPPTLDAATYDSPYETVLPPFNPGHLRRESFSRARSPYEQAMAEQQNAMPPPPPPPPAPPTPGADVKLNETSLPPRSQSSTSGYRHPKDVRANMPPDHLQAGALGSGSTGFL